MVGSVRRAGLLSREFGWVGAKHLRQNTLLLAIDFAANASPLQGMRLNGCLAGQGKMSKVEEVMQSAPIGQNSVNRREF
jgi:hypothetical protein